MKTNFYIIAAITISMQQIAAAQNLLVNGDFSAGNSGFSSDYIFVSSGQSHTPDTFGVRTNSQDFNTAYTLFGDHTTGGGMMAFFDGYPAPDKVAWSETVLVSTNANYQFSGWATSADPFNPATLHFLINGSAAGPDLSLSTNAGAWTNFVVVWNSGANATATLAIVDQSTVDYGNDFALDDLVFGSTQPSLAIRQTAPQAFELSWVSLTNVNYQVQWASSLEVTNNWHDLGTPIPGNGKTNYFPDAPSTNATRFYRLQVAP